ncbi:class B sortase [Butyrivibrio sp. MC2013]|uniref:class B sortase n=1 Tax=Butyrivibrio sp. MC2013 TaxID=1280686 RepID=UPI00041D6EFA|nr:class B sortase [Butyrivibrio sp. MC2013]
MQAHKKWSYILIVSLLALVIGALSYMAADSLRYRHELEAMRELARDEGVEIADGDMALSGDSDEAYDNSSSAPGLEDPAGDNGVSDGNGQTDISNAYEAPVDIEALRETNPDIFAWVSIPGTSIDYPIAQHPSDDGYYLKHGPDGTASVSGCPYIEICDSSSFLEFNTVIYGHNMNDGSVFAGLHCYKNNDFYNEHRLINIYTAEHCLEYRVFAAVMYDDKRIPYYYDDTIESDRTAFLESLKTDSVSDHSIISDDIEVTEDDCIVTLSTCDKKLRNNRYLVIAVLTRIDGQDVRSNG